MDDVAIVGVGQSVFARKCGVSVKELCFDAYKEAIEGPDLTNKDIDASITCSALEYDKQRTPSGLISEYLELTPKPAFYIESVWAAEQLLSQIRQQKTNYRLRTALNTIRRLTKNFLQTIRLLNTGSSRLRNPKCPL